MDPKSEMIDKIMRSMSDAMGVEIAFGQDPNDNGKVIPIYDINAILSKMLALFVVSGLNVPHSFAPPYNRVHADVEWWKGKFEALAKVPSQSEELPLPPDAVIEEDKNGADQPQ